MNGQIPFLDVLVINNGNDGLEFDIYRKPTFTGRFITSDSFHNFQHKMAAFHSMAKRMVSMPLSSDRYDKERNFIIETGRINGYERKTIENIIKVHERRNQQAESSVLFLNQNREDKKRIVVPFDPIVGRKLSGVYRELGYEMVTCKDYSLQNKLKSTKNDIPPILCSAIYEIRCQDGCLFIYNGMTQRNPTVRFEEHLDAIIKSDFRSSAAKHMVKMVTPRILVE